jgi:hypothetical protein
MRDALAAFERGILDGVVRHQGDPVLDEHLRWTAADRSEAGELRRVSKADRTRPIDAVVAVALAYWRVSAGAGASKYETEPLLALSATSEREEPGGRLVDGEWLPET